jgi:hypothetical protein
LHKGIVDFHLIGLCTEPGFLDGHRS